MRPDAAVILIEMGFLLDADFEVIGNADGTSAVRWFSGQPQPTDAELDAAALGAHQAIKVASIRAEARTRIEDKYPEWRQRSAALGVYPAEYVTQMQSDIAAVIAASNAGEDAVDAAADIAAVNAVNVNWPVI